MLLPYGSKLFIIDNLTGEVIFSMDDFSFDYPISLESFTRNGLLVQDGNELFIGSANGTFSKITKDAFIAQLDY